MSEKNHREITRRHILKGAATLAAVSVLPDLANSQKASVSVSHEASTHLTNKRDQLFDLDWRFYLGNGDGAERPDFKDSSWRKLDLPHDWSIEDLPKRPHSGPSPALWMPEGVPSRIGPFDRQFSPGQSATGYVLGGTGWYRKSFSVAHLPADRDFQIRFDGVYMDSDVWINGEHLGNHPYGYTSFAFDLTPHLSRDANNVLAVRVRNEGKNSRWYSGSGIFRHVWLTMTGDVRVAQWGLYVSTPEVSSEAATVKVTTEVENRSNQTQSATVRIRLLAPQGEEVAKQDVPQTISQSGTENVEHSFQLKSPLLWSAENPNLYHAYVEVLLGGSVIDEYSTSFGIRRIEVDAERGLRINGDPVKLKGACLHHDNGVLGAACFDRAEQRRVELMKANGFNAIRTAHNPPSPAFLDACDRLGIMIINEAFDMWEAPKNPEDYHRFFDEWWQRDLSSMVLRDRNHPSVIFWSIGNEIHERADSKGVEIAKHLVDAVKQLDSTRPVTMAVCWFWDYPGRDWKEVQPAFTHLDVGGYNYQWKLYESDHAQFPERVMMGTESFPLEALENWQAVEKHSYVIGDFVWTGMDYLGESGLGHVVLEGDPDAYNGPYPWFNAFCGDIDLIGEKKAQSYFRDVVWGRSKLEMAVQRPLPPKRKEKISKWGWSDELRSWTWPGFEGQELKVRVYSSADQVRLLLNGKEVDTKAISPETKLTAEFDVAYTPGELEAIALKDGKEIEKRTLRTAGEPAKLRLIADHEKIKADRNDLAYVTVEVLDAGGSLAPDAMLTIHFSVEGAGKLIAVGSADPRNVASFQQPQGRTFQGKGLAILQSSGARGLITLRASSEGLAPATIRISTV